MSAYHDSRFVPAEPNANCDRCGRRITPSFPVLDWRAGKGRPMTICLICAKAMTQFGPKYDCPDVRDMLEIPRRG